MLLFIIQKKYQQGRTYLLKVALIYKHSCNSKVTHKAKWKSEFILPPIKARRLFPQMLFLCTYTFGEQCMCVLRSCVFVFRRLCYLFYFQCSDSPIRKHFFWHFRDENVTKHRHWLVVLRPILVTPNLKCQQCSTQSICQIFIKKFIPSWREDPKCYLYSDFCHVSNDAPCLSHNIAWAWQQCEFLSPRSSSKSQPLCWAEDPELLWTHWDINNPAKSKQEI